MTHPDLPYQDATPSQSAIEAIKSYQASKGHVNFILLAGDVGTGKTWDACGLALRVCRKERRSQQTGFYADRSVIRFVRCCMIQDYDNETMLACHNAKALILDDYGIRKSPGSLVRVFELVDKRMHNKSQVTIMTTNLIGEIKELDEAMASRLNKACIIDYTDKPDLRRKRE